jgi:hypothetical protein
VSDFRLHQRALMVGTVFASVVLIRFAIDFWSEMGFVLSLAFVSLVAVALGVAINNVRSLGYATEVAGKFPDLEPQNQKTSFAFSRIILLASVPVGFLASSLDCTGLSWQGCTPFCTLIKIVWIPLIAIVSLVAWIRRLDKRWLTVVTLMSFLPLVPHCVCYNVGNGWWIDRIGASPTCYAWGFVVSLIAVGALRSRRQLLSSAVVCGVIICGATGFFVAHHYLHYPW